MTIEGDREDLFRILFYKKMIQYRISIFFLENNDVGKICKVRVAKD